MSTLDNLDKELLTNITSKLQTQEMTQLSSNSSLCLSPLANSAENVLREFKETQSRDLFLGWPSVSNSQKAFKTLGISEESVKRGKALRTMGVTEDDYESAKNVFRQRQLDIARQRPKVNDKVQCVLGASFGEVERSKARKTLGVTEEEIEDDRSKQLAQLGLPTLPQDYDFTQKSERRIKVVGRFSQKHERLRERREHSQSVEEMKHSIFPQLGKSLIRSNSMTKVTNATLDITESLSRNKSFSSNSRRESHDMVCSSDVQPTLLQPDPKTQSKTQENVHSDAKHSIVDSNHRVFQDKQEPISTIPLEKSQQKALPRESVDLQTDFQSNQLTEKRISMLENYLTIKLSKKPNSHSVAPHSTRETTESLRAISPSRPRTTIAEAKLYRPQSRSTTPM